MSYNTSDIRSYKHQSRSCQHPFRQDHTSTLLASNQVSTQNNKWTFHDWLPSLWSTLALLLSGGFACFMFAIQSCSNLVCREPESADAPPPRPAAATASTFYHTLCVLLLTLGEYVGKKSTYGEGFLLD